MHYACLNNQHSAVDFLIGKGADCTITNKVGQAAVYYLPQGVNKTKEYLWSCKQDKLKEQSEAVTGVSLAVTRIPYLGINTSNTRILDSPPTQQAFNTKNGRGKSVLAVTGTRASTTRTKLPGTSNDRDGDAVRDSGGSVASSHMSVSSTCGLSSKKLRRVLSSRRHSASLQLGSGGAGVGAGAGGMDNNNLHDINRRSNIEASANGFISDAISKRNNNKLYPKKSSTMSCADSVVSRLSHDDEDFYTNHHYTNQTTHDAG